MRLTHTQGVVRAAAPGRPGRRGSGMLDAAPMLMATSALVLLNDAPRLALTAVACGMVVLRLGRVNAAIWLLMFTPGFAGDVARRAGLAGVGSVAVVLFGAGLLFGRRHESIACRWWAPAWWLGAVVAMLLLAYSAGPQTRYSQEKVVGFILQGGLGLASFWALFAVRGVDYARLGAAAVCLAAVWYAFLGFSDPGIMPSSIAVPAGLRHSAAEAGGEVTINGISNIAAMGVVLALSGLVTKGRAETRARKLAVALAMAGGMLIVNSVGQRLAILVPPLSALALFVVSPNRRAALFGGLAVTAIVVAIFVAGIRRDDDVFSSVIEADSAGQRANRASNWDAALERFVERPWFGHGLGGYYISGFSRPGDAVWAHNLVLELLSETGVVGTIIALGPLLAFIGRRWRRLAGAMGEGGPVLPLLVAIAIRSLISDDLRQSTHLFAACAVAWALTSAAPRLAAAGEVCIGKVRRGAIG